MPRVTTLLESWLLSPSDPFWFPEELWCGKGERARPSSSSQTCSVVPFTGRLLCWAWQRGSSQSSLTTGTRVGSGCLGRGSPWLDARIGRGKRFPSVVQSTTGSGSCFRACLERGWREAGERLERGWREAGERLERGWREAGERLERELVPMYHLL